MIEEKIDLELIRKKYDKEYPLGIGTFEDLTEINKIYHYTSIDAIKNIILSRRLWLSNCQFLNDSQEIIYTKGLINEVFNKINNNLFDDIINIYTETVSDIKNMFVLSSTSDKDNITLWYNYARNEGYNLGFDLETLIDLINPSENKTFGMLTKSVCQPDEVTGIMLYDKVIYEKAKQIEFIESVFKNYELAIKNEKNLRVIYNLKILTVHRLLICSLFFKNSAFAAEKEFRIVVNAHSGIDKILHHRTFNGIFIPYIEIGISPIYSDKLPIDSICIGPKNNFDITKKGLVSFLELCGYSDFKDIYKSEIPLRF